MDCCCECAHGLSQEACVDTDDGAANDWGNGCNWYAENPEVLCSLNNDDTDFTALDMCCACGGGEDQVTTPAPEVCEDDDEGFVFNASFYGIAVTSCADAPGWCTVPEPASFCCATCAEALMKCEDYDDLLPVVSNYTIFDCSTAVAYGACEF
jgi:hypothetical protein